MTFIKFNGFVKTCKFFIKFVNLYIYDFYKLLLLCVLGSKSLFEKKNYKISF